MSEYESTLLRAMKKLAARIDETLLTESEKAVFRGHVALRETELEKSTRKTGDYRPEDLAVLVSRSK